MLSYLTGIMKLICDAVRRRPFKLDQFKSESYQHYQGEKLAKRFNAFSYYFLSKSMDAHNVGRERGSVEQALGQITAKTLVIGITTDIIFPVAEQQFIADHIPGARFKIDSFILSVMMGFSWNMKSWVRCCNQFLEPPLDGQSFYEKTNAEL